MIDFLISSSEIAATQDILTVLSPGDLNDVPRLNAIALGDALTPGFSAEIQIVLSNTEGRTGLPCRNSVSGAG